MAISEAKVKIVIDNYFPKECNINTTIREAFEKGFCLGLQKAIPAADVVEVVRCGECIYRTSGFPFCQGRPNDWFCANGYGRTASG